MSIQEIFKRMFSRKSVLTIPNLLSLVRLCLIPVMVWLYCGRQHYIAATAVVVLSGLTDIADGYIARTFHQISDLGKLLDPVADKLTQLAMMLCLIQRYPWIWKLIGLLVVKELVQARFMLQSVTATGHINSSSWYGKVSTAALYAVMVILFLVPQIPEAVAVALCGVCAGLLVFALVAYVLRYLPQMREGLAK